MGSSKDRPAGMDSLKIDWGKKQPKTSMSDVAKVAGGRVDAGRDTKVPRRTPKD